MHEFNDGLRPHYDEVFDEAIDRNSKGKPLDSIHEQAILKIVLPYPNCYELTVKNNVKIIIK